MGLFDFFTESGRTFNWLYDNYFDATELAYRAKKGVFEGRLSSKRLTRNIPNEDKAWLAEQEHSILEIDKCIKDDRLKQEIINAAKKYKRAFLYFCKKEGIGPSFFFSMENRPSMPGETVFRSFRPLASFSAKSYERPLYPLKTINIWDKHFQDLVEDALAEYGYKPKFAYENSAFMIKERMKYIDDLVLRFSNSEGSVSELDSLIESTKSRFPYGIKILFNNKISVERTDGRQFIVAMHQHVPEFDKLEKEITTLVERETIWKHFEDQILANDFGQRYYRSYFKENYGTDLVSLDKYEAIVKNKELFDTYIRKQEAGYDSLKQKYRFGLEEFEKRNPNIPHTEYPKYSSSIAWFEEKSLSYLFAGRQTKLTGNLADAVSSLSGWDAFIKEIEVQCEDYDLNRFTSQTSRAFIHRYLTYGDNNTMTEYERYHEIDKSKFKYCSDIFNNTLAIKNLAKWDSKEILDELNSVLTKVIPVYMDMFRNMRMVLAGDLWNYLGNQENAKSQIRRLPALEGFNSRIDVVINYEFEERAAWMPHLFLTIETSPDVLDAAAPNHILSSFISISLGIDYNELKKIDDKREKRHKEIQRGEILSLKRQYPFGFRTFCVNQFGTDDESCLEYDAVIASKNEIKRIQWKEDERIREAKKLDEERKTISRAIAIAQRYPTAFHELCPSIVEIDTLDKAKSVIAYENRLTEFDSIYCKKEDLFEHQRMVCGLPHKYFYDYYSKKKYGDGVSPEADSNRRLIWAFKDGVLQQRVVTLVVDFLRASRIASFGGKITFACIPASDPFTNRSRYEWFSAEVCKSLGFRNAFEHIRVCSSVTPRRMGGTRMAELEIDGEFFKDSFVLLFDDVVTYGTTASHRKSLIESTGAHCIGIISLGKTV